MGNGKDLVCMAQALDPVTKDSALVDVARSNRYALVVEALLDNTTAWVTRVSIHNACLGNSE